MFVSSFNSLIALSSSVRSALQKSAGKREQAFARMNFATDDENVTALDDNRVGRQKNRRVGNAFKLRIFFIFLDVFKFAFEMREKFRLF